MNTNQNNKREEKRFFCRINKIPAEFGMSRSHVLTLIREGILPSYLPSPKIRLVKISDLFEYIENSKVEVSDEK